MTLRERAPAPAPARGHEGASARAHEGTRGRTRGGTRAIVALGTLLALVGIYLAVRPTLRVPYLSLVEYPIAVALVAFLVWQAVRRPRPRAAPMASPAQARAPAQAPALRRHEQLVRTLPDPELLALERALGSWIESGADAERAARILASAAGRDADGPAAMLLLVQQADTRKARARLVHRYASGD